MSLADVKRRQKMKVIIDISEKIYDTIMSDEMPTREQMSAIVIRIYQGTPLPKGHGRLIDVEWIDDNCSYYYSDEDARLCYSVNDVNNAPTIIEADKEV